MSELRTLIEAPRWLDALAAPAPFRIDPRFCEAPAPLPVEDEAAVAVDEIYDAFARGLAEGHAQAREEYEAKLALRDAAREGLSLAFAKLDTALEEELRLRLTETVAALCEAAIAPFAIDPEALARRVTRAAAMLARADDERVVRLHPEDVAMLSDTMRAQWTIVPDAALERGALRIESAHGGVEDGPETWRAAIAQALHQG